MRGYVAFLDLLGFSERVKREDFSASFRQYSEIITSSLKPEEHARLEMSWYWRYKYHIFYLFLLCVFLTISGDLMENKVLYLLGQIVFSIVGVIIFISIIQIVIDVARFDSIYQDSEVA